MKNHLRTTCALLAATLVSAASANTVFAADGQVAITQARAAAGGVTPGDAPGFPVTITQPGSYVLSSNLIVPNANTDAIVISTSHVTIDLNGFAILGPTDCSGGLSPCAGDGHGSGIRTLGNDPQFNITIRNGTIQGMGSIGVFLGGDSNLVEYVHVRSNGASGIQTFPSQDRGPSIVQYCTAQRNALEGIFVEIGMAIHNVSSLNGLAGIAIQVGSASYNVVTGNPIGLALSGEASYIGNTFNANAQNASGNAHNFGQNLCGTAVCSGSQF